MRKAGFGLIAFLLAGFTAKSQLSIFQKKIYSNKTDTLPYRILFPDNYDSSKKYPLVIFLHGAGERGADNQKQLLHGSKLFLDPANRSAFPAIVVFPQCPEESYWSNVNKSIDNNGHNIFSFQEDGEPTKAMKLLQGLLHELLTIYPVKETQVYICGISMGAMGTFEIVRREPGIFAAAFAICGGANPATANKIKSIPWWVFHGAEDDIVPVEYSVNIVNALEHAGAKVKFTIYPEAGHTSWFNAFAEPELLSWLFAQSK